MATVNAAFLAKRFGGSRVALLAAEQVFGCGRLIINAFEDKLPDAGWNMLPWPATGCQTLKLLLAVCKLL
jgi:hypothetical protein